MVKDHQFSFQSYPKAQCATGTSNFSDAYDSDQSTRASSIASVSSFGNASGRSSCQHLHKNKTQNRKNSSISDFPSDLSDRSVSESIADPSASDNSEEFASSVHVSSLSSFSRSNFSGRPRCSCQAMCLQGVRFLKKFVFGCCLQRTRALEWVLDLALLFRTTLQLRC